MFPGVSQAEFVQAVNLVVALSIVCGFVGAFVYDFIDTIFRRILPGFRRHNRRKKGVLPD